MAEQNEYTYESPTRLSILYRQSLFLCFGCFATPAYTQKVHLTLYTVRKWLVMKFGVFGFSKSPKITSFYPNFFQKVQSRFFKNVDKSRFLKKVWILWIFWIFILSMCIEKNRISSFINILRFCFSIYSLKTPSKTSKTSKKIEKSAPILNPFQSASKLKNSKLFSKSPRN